MPIECLANTDGYVFLIARGSALDWNQRNIDALHEVAFVAR